MPTYEFQCLVCNKKQEVFMRLADFKIPECCGHKTKQVIGNYNVIGDVEPYLDVNIGTEPIWVRSKKHRKQLMKEHGVQEKYGKGWR